jgi:putative hemolysin
MTPILIVAGEITPKVFAIKNSLRFSILVARPINGFIKFISPLRWLFKGISGVIIDLLRGKEVAPSNIIKEDVVRTLVDVGEKDGVLETTERELIHKVFDFGDTPVYQIMTPRPDIFSLSSDLSLEDVLDQVRQSRRSRIPIYKDNPDNIIGILYTKDLLGSYQFQENELKKGWHDLLRDPYFVPWSKKGLALFKDFQKKKIHMAIVVDEYGGIAGLVTMEDLLEELFGEIGEEPEPKERPFEPLAPDKYRVSSRLLIKEFNKLLDTQLPDDQQDTIGGFVFSLFGQLPQEGEKIQYQNLCFEIEEVKGTRIQWILVHKQEWNTGNL